MKKILIALTIATSALTAQAVEVSAYGSRNLAGTDNTAVGISVGQSFGPVTVTAFADRTLNRSKDFSRFGVLGSYDVINYGPLSFNMQAGAARVVTTGADGYALITGIGSEYAFTKNTSLVLDFHNQRGQQKISNLNGNTISAGVKYTF